MFPLLFSLVACDPFWDKPVVPDDADADGFDVLSDCDDTRAEVYPGAEERCDGLDNDCDGERDIDALDAGLYYLDNDGDGEGDPLAAVRACSAPEGATIDAEDCDDARDDIRPGATEDCDGLDNDCDGTIDEGGTTGPSSYRDADGDGYGDSTWELNTCLVLDGYVLDNTDCDDADPTVSPGAPERCGGGDEDCDGIVDESDLSVVDLTAFYEDADGDGWGNTSTVHLLCAPDAGDVAVGGDCNDTDPTVNPDGVERCDSADRDEDCDGLRDDFDPGALDPGTFYLDNDLDGFGGATTVLACDAAADRTSTSDDCDDADPTLYPGATEVCDGRDQDCDGAIDEDLAERWYADLDRDGWGDPMIWLMTCAPPIGYVTQAPDCDDTNPLVFPGSTDCPEATPAPLAPDTAAPDSGLDSGLDSGDSSPTSDDSAESPPADSGDSGDSGDTGSGWVSTGELLRFVVLGDTGDGSSGQYAVADGIETVCDLEGCDFVLLAGDNFYPGGVADIYDPLWTDNFELPYANIDLQFRAVMGNHDWDSGTDPARLDAQVNYTTVSTKWYMPAGYYTFVEDDTTFFGIDTHLIDRGQGAAQEAWIPGARAASTTSWNLIFGHHPYISNGPHGNADPNIESFFDTYVCGQFDVYFAGHDHNLQWLDDTCGTTFIVSGAGHSTYSLIGSNPVHFEVSSLGFLWVEIDRDLFTGVFYDQDGVELYRESFFR